MRRKESGVQIVFKEGMESIVKKKDLQKEQERFVLMNVDPLAIFLISQTALTWLGIGTALQIVWRNDE